LEEAPVVADEHERGARLRLLVLLPLVGGAVVLVGGVVVVVVGGGGAPRARARRPPGLPAGKRIRRLAAGQPELLQQVARAVRVVARPEPRLHIR
jgi:hypothetical protein